MTELPTRYDHFRQFLRTLETATEDPPAPVPLTQDPSLFSAVFESVSEGIFICDPRMRIVGFNRAAEEITGYRRDEVVGKECVEVCSGKLCGVECAVCQTLVTRAPLRDGHLKLLRKDGRARVVQLNTSLLRDPEGRPAGVVVLFRDMTELAALQRELRQRHRFHGLVGQNPRMQEIYQLVESLAETDTTVLIEGESGTGKELLAAALHFESARARGPYVRVGCGALPPTLLESELFGHVKGAFTGAIRDKVGRFELAHGGTIFLDDVNDLPLELQAKFLRVLQERTLERVGHALPIKVDVRVIAAANRSLKGLVEQGRFREDLYYRLNVVPVSLPPLRERKDDIPLLVRHFVETFNRKMNRQVEGVSREALRAFMSHDWPGNVRELENALEHAFVRSRGATLQPKDFPAHPLGSGGPLLGPRRSLSRQELLRVLKASGWNAAEAARIIGVHRSTVIRWIRRFRLSTP